MKRFWWQSFRTTDAEFILQKGIRFLNVEREREREIKQIVVYAVFKKKKKK